MGKGQRADVYFEVRKRRGHIFLNETSACDRDRLGITICETEEKEASTLFYNIVNLVIINGKICLRLVFCVPNVASLSGLSILDCPFSIL